MKSSSPMKSWRRPSFAIAAATSPAIGTARTFPDFGVVSLPRIAGANTYGRYGEVDVAPAKGEDLPRRIPVNAAGEVDRAVHLVLGGAHQAPHLFWREHLDVAARPHTEAVHLVDGVEWQPVELHRPAEDRVQQDQQVVLGLVRQTPARFRPRSDQSASLDVLSGDVLDPSLPNTVIRWAWIA